MDSCTSAAEMPLVAVGGTAGVGRPGGLGLVSEAQVEVIDSLDTPEVAVTDGRVERVLGDGERVALYDRDGLLAIETNDEGARPSSGGSGGESMSAATVEGSRLSDSDGNLIVDLGAPIAAFVTLGVNHVVLANPADGPPFLCAVGEGPDDIGPKVELPFGHASSLAPVDPDLAAGLRVGGRVNPTRVAESQQERAFRAAGVNPSSLWAAGVPLSIPDCRVEIAADNPTTMQPGARVQVPYRLRNDGSAILATTGRSPVYISARWHDPQTGAEISDVIHFRSPLERSIPPGVTHNGTMTLGAPTRSGEYHVQITLLQEHVRWFSEVDDRSAQWVVIEVGQDGSPSPHEEMDR